MPNFDEYWKEYQGLPYECKRITEWLDRVGDDIQHGIINILNRDELYRFSIAVRHANATCRECDCQKK